MELTISATEFKAKCLDLFTQLSDHRLSRVTVTRRGKPVAAVTAPVPDKDAVGRLHGFMAGTVFLPDDIDLTAPIFDDEIEAESGRLHR